MDDDIFARQKLVGYDAKALENAVFAVEGAGALANNFVQNAALSGAGEFRIADNGTIEPSNAPRSPLFSRGAALSERPRNKARELAVAALAVSYAKQPRVRYAAALMQTLGLGAFKGVSVVVSAVDSFKGRAWIANATRLLGIPMVEGGFSGSQGHIAVFSNARADAPCYRCLNPRAEPGGMSCTLYARGVLEQGAIPATQSIAALTGAYVAEAAIRLLHDEGSPLADRMLTFNVREGGGVRVNLVADPECPGEHRRIEDLESVAVHADDPASSIFDALTGFDAPEIILPAEYLVEAPCARCGAPVPVGKPDWAIASPPACAKCGDRAAASPRGIHVISRVRPGDPLSRRSCRKLGLPPCAVFEVVDGTSGASRWFELAGSIDDLYVTKSRARIERGESDAFTPVTTAEGAEPVQQSMLATHETTDES